ncbi:SemiSWEET family sugar transporter [Aquimarina sp. RZ0]|uniref:SemiSWEET family sugar transporter n=1 Tax=Aquimarina sp. RZ0 TaxID=2607730 RepID=UPI0011F2414D|nr:SemiSWEET family transporter [Aquimarina sp. RZ0]KAA1245807.1 hypothetical protein F0000_10425 [Aquimarina sp. RZ0]
MNLELIGLIAAGFTTGSFLPQVYQTFKIQSTESLSTTMLIIYLIGALLWLIYGYITNSIAIIISSGLTSLLQLVLLYGKIRFTKKEKF